MNEIKILFNNIRNFRHLLTEGVSRDTIKKAIENHEWLYIYYNADNKEGKNATGYRSIRPYVLGTNANGNLMLRAWQDNSSNSWHFDNKPTRKDSHYHDYWNDSEGTKPGWRMFNVEKILTAYPTGKKFNDENGLPLIPAGYHEGGDDNMTSIIAYVSTKNEPDFQYKYEKTYEPEKVPKIERNRAKWDSIRRGNKNNRRITADDIIKLRNIANRVKKTALGNFLVVIDDKNNFNLISVKDKDRQHIPDIAIVGSLPDLINNVVNQNAPESDKFFNDVKNRTQAELKSNLQNTKNELKEEKPSIPYKRMTFFK